MAAAQPLQVDFIDSSDNDNSHAAGIDIVPDGNGRQEQQARENSGTPQLWWGSLSNALDGASTRFFGNYGSANTEPFPVEQTRMSDTSSPLDRVCNDVGASSSTSFDSTDTSGSTYGEENVLDDPSTRSVHVDLREAILQYQRTPSPLGLNMILATLKSGTTLIDGNVFSAAAGNPFLIRTCLDSGFVDTQDPVVRRIIQEELERVLVGDPYKGEYVDASQADYLRVLCNVPSSRISQQQMVLLRYSGFEFIKIMFDCPHLLADLAQPKMWTYLPFRVLHIVNLVTGWLTIIVSLLSTAATVWITVYWLIDGRQRNYGYWTIICYVGGYVVSFVCTMRMEQDKIKRYEDQVWSYPDNNVKVIPIIPFFEIALTYTALRYELLEDKRAYFVIRYDLRKGMGLQQMIHCFCFAIPQLILQGFLFTDRNTNRAERGISAVCFWLLVGSSLASFIISIFAYVRMVIFPHSCNALGFAFMTIDSTKHSNYQKQQRVMPAEIITRMLNLFTLYFLDAAAMSLLIYLLNLSGCNASVKIFLSIDIAVVSITIVGILLIMVYAKFSNLMGLACIPALIMQIAYFPFTKVNAQSQEVGSCSLLMYHTSAWMCAMFITFGCVCVSFLGWLGIILYQVFTRKPIHQTLLDTYLDM